MRRWVIARAAASVRHPAFAHPSSSAALANSFAGILFSSLRQPPAATAAPPESSGGAVMVPSPPEFEGEDDAGPPPPAAASPSAGGGGAAGAASSKKSLPPSTPAASPGAAVVGSSSPVLVSPLLSVRKTLSGIQLHSKTIQEEAGRVAEAYKKYFDHIRFRNGWATPAFTEADVKPLFDEAAYIVIRMRSYLDRKAKGETRLRQLDGEAQKFLHSDAAAPMLKKDPRKFLLALIDATFRDAVGYVEGLTRAAVLQLVAEIQMYQYNPRVHALHVVARLEDALQRAPLLAEMGLATNEHTALVDNSYYVEDGSPADGKWRSAVKQLYQALEEVEASLKANSKK